MTHNVNLEKSHFGLCLINGIFKLRKRKRILTTIYDKLLIQSKSGALCFLSESGAFYLVNLILDLVSSSET